MLEETGQLDDSQIQDPVPDNPVQGELFINIEPDPLEQKEIVRLCNELKKNLQHHAREKKEIMRDCYAASKGQLQDKDLLPMPSTDGSDKEEQNARPQIFIQKTRQIVKTLYSFLRLSFFPSDDGYVRIVGRNALSAQVEDQLTEGFQWLLDKNLIKHQISDWFQSLVVTGNAACFPSIEDRKIMQWVINPLTQSYEEVPIDQSPMPSLEVYDPLHFYIDPNEKDPDNAKWGYFSHKKLKEIQDSNLYFNKDQLKRSADKTTKSSNQSNNDIETTGLNQLNTTFKDNEDHVDYDFYYFPYLKTNQKEYRNMMVGIGAEDVLIRFHPNMSPRGMNPLVFWTYSPDLQSPYGIGPVEDGLEYQRLINILYNYVTEVLARIGNEFVVGDDVDTSQAFGVAARMFVAPDPRNAVIPISGNYGEPAALLNFAGTLAADMQMTSGAQNTFQGASQIDFKKTATELQINQENNLTGIRETIEHIATGVKRIFELLMYQAADIYKKPLEIRVDEPNGPEFKVIDFSIINQPGYEFDIELTNVNPSQSKRAQVENMQELLALVIQNPESIFYVDPLLKEMGELQGFKKTGEILEQLKERIIQLATGQSGVSQAQSAVGIEQQQGLAGSEGIPIQSIGPEDPPLEVVG